MSENADKSPVHAESEVGKKPPEPVDDLVTTRHSVTTVAGPVDYHVSAGRIVLREENHEDGIFKGHQPKAELFVVAYTADGADSARRPVTFALNGGPGAASVWLHLGLLGPRRVLMGDAGSLLPPPFGLADNAETLLAHSDLVFIDPISTGYSRVVEGGKPTDYHGYQGDLEAVGEVIRLWTSRNGRWLSPKFVVGESYGGTRASALSDHLQSRYGLYLNGVMLISPALDMGTFRFNEGNDTATVLFLPTYAYLAHYHGMLDRPLEQVRAEAEELALGDYPRALAMGDRLPAAERTALVGRLSRVTGLSPRWIEAANLRVENQRFFAEILRERGQVIGRFDGRFAGWDPDGVREHPESDPSYVAVHGPYAAAMNHYVRRELEYANDLPYELFAPHRVQPWSFKEFEARHITVADRLSAAIRHNRHLRVQIACGYYDGATPYFAAEHVIAHLHIPEELRRNVELRYYEAGHMIYVHEPSRLQQSADLAAFVT